MDKSKHLIPPIAVSGGFSSGLGGGLAGTHEGTHEFPVDLPSDRLHIQTYPGAILPGCRKRKPGLPRQPSGHQRRISSHPMRIRLVLTLALALCVFLRFYRLDGYGLWSDEFVTLLIVSSQTFEEVVRTCFEVPQ